MPDEPKDQPKNPHWSERMTLEERNQRIEHLLSLLRGKDPWSNPEIISEFRELGFYVDFAPPSFEKLKLATDSGPSLE